MKTILIKQPLGLGDIFFCQKIAKTLLKNGHKIIWPVNSSIFSEVKNLDCDIQFVNKDDNFFYKTFYEQTPHACIREYNECIVIATDGCCNLNSNGVMLSKYELTNIDHNDWLKYFSYKRDYNKEKELFYNILDLKKEDTYCLINKNIGSVGHESHWNIPEPDNIKKIYLKKIKDFTLFDWSTVIENAQQFYVMESSITYLIEKLNTNATVYNMYGRSEKESLNFIDYTKMYTTKPWNFYDKHYNFYMSNSVK